MSARRAGDSEDADFKPVRDGGEPRDLSFEKWAAAALGTILISGIMFLAGRDRKAIDDSFTDSRRDRAEIRLLVTAHETQIQLMKQQMDSLQGNYEKLSAQNEALATKLDTILREVKK